MENVLAIVLVGGVGQRLNPLTKETAKPAVPFGGVYRIIDFTLSNCINSGARRILVLAQYKALDLIRHVRDGWNILSPELGEYIEVLPPMKRVHSDWYQGTADAVFQNFQSIEAEAPELTLILAGDHIYKMNYREMLECHRQNRADVTIATLQVAPEEASRYGIAEIDASHRIVGFEEKPKHDHAKRSRFDRSMVSASMGIYVFDTNVLLQALHEDAEEPGSGHDFGHDVLPRLLQRQLSPYPNEDIRYTPTIEESIERLKAATYEQVAQLYRVYLGSQAGELSIVGDFDADTCLPILKDTLAGWKATKPYTRITSPLTAEVAGSQHKINTPDKANATFTTGLLFPMRDDDADYPALVMGNYMFGGGTLSSRLGNRIRQKEGLSYGVTSGLSVSSEDQRAGFTITAIVNPQNLVRLQQCALEELDRLLRDGVATEELDRAREGYLQTLKLGRASDTALAGTLGSLRHLDRTMAWESDLEKKIAALTPEEVKSALNRHIDPKKLVVVAAGDFEAR